MTVSVASGRVSYATNGTTGPFTIPFYFLAATHLDVVHKSSTGVETLLTLTTDYSVTGAGSPIGGTLTTVATYAVGGTLTIIRNVPTTQEVDYVDGDDFPAETHETALDKLTMIAQQQAEALNRALVMSAGTTASGELPDAATRADKLLAFDSSGNPTVTTPSAGTALALATDLAAASAVDGAAMVGFLQAGTGAVARTVQAKLRDAVSVKDFGAVGDGATNDTAAIQAAIDASACVYFPAGTYKISSPLTIPANAYLFGAGWSSIIKTDAAATRFIMVLVDTATEQDGPTIRDLAFDGSSKGQLDAGLIQLNGAIGFVCERLYVHSAGTAGESASQGVNGIAAAVDGLGNAGSIGVIRDCLIESCTKAGINVSTETSGVLVEGNTVRNCTGNTETPGIQVAGGYNTRIIGNRVHGCQGSGIILGTTGGVGTYRHPRYAVVMGNQCSGNGTGSVSGHGIYIGNLAGQSDVFGRMVLAHNVCYENGATYTSGAGIRVENQDALVIEGNLLYSNKSAGLVIQNCRNVQVSGGLIEDNNTGNASDVAGIYVLTSGSSEVERLAVHGVKFRNTGNQDYPIFFDGSNPADSVLDFQFLDNEATGHATRDFPLTTLPRRTELRHTFDFTTSDGSATNAGYFTLPDESAFKIRASVVAKKDDASDRAMYDRIALVYRDAAGSATIQGSVQDVITPVESAAGWDATIVVTGNVAAVAVTGAGATTIRWRITVEVISV